MVPRRRFHASSVSAVLGLLLLTSYVGCLPDLDKLSVGDGEAGDTGTGGTAGTESGGTSGTSGTNGKGGEETGGTGNRPSGGTSGTAGDGGQAGDDTGGTGGACSADVVVGTPDGNTVTDCGECGLTCSVRNASGSACTEGSCEPICRTGYDNCNPGELNDGCETAITTPDNCGACGIECSETEVEIRRCTSGMCAPTCATARLDCNAATENDGCETPESATNCGSCGYACTVQHATATSCAAGRCAPSCHPGYGNCNSAAPPSVDDGCETFLDSLTACTPACGGTAVDCDATSVCNSGSCGAPQGLAVLSVPLAAPMPGAEAQRYATLFPTNPDMTNATVTMRLYAPGATGGRFYVYFSDSMSASNNMAYWRRIELADLASGWTDQTFTVGPSGGGFNATSVKQITFEVESVGTTGPWTNPTIIYIDSVRSSNHVVNEHFSTRATTLPPLPGTMVMSTMQRPIPGSTLDWADAVPP